MGTDRAPLRRRIADWLNLKTFRVTSTDIVSAVIGALVGLGAALIGLLLAIAWNR
ncbi:hypothetical protein [Streptomyces tsukubensis]|uniref:hypothetical protein n=1 Tax=Streptomyces tsukubensis TaxID=83656 RepID=UPI0034500A39